MNITDIQKLFSVQKSAAASLHEQLTDAFQSFIAANPAETRIPSERKIAEALGIDRGTVKKVITSFARQGLVVRNGRSGTFTAGKKNGQSALHPMEMASFFVEDPVKTLRLALYESMPPIRDFWEKAVLQFNRKHRNIQVTIEWIPEISYDNYSDYLQRSNPDLLQIAVRNDFDYAVAPIPRDFYQELCDEQSFLSGNLDEESRAVMRTIVPVHFSTMVHAYNAPMAEKLGFSDVEGRLNKSPRDLVRECAGKIEPGKYVAGNLWDHFLAAGIPENDSAVDFEFFAASFRETASLQLLNNAFLTEQQYSLESLERFLAGEIFLFTGHLFMLERYRTTAPFNMNYCVPKISPERRFPCVYSGMAVAAGSAYPEQAFKFLRFVLSPDIQRQLLSRGSCAFRKECNELDKTELKLNRKAFDRALSATINIGCRKNNSSYFLVFCLKDVFHRFMQRELTHEQAAAIAWERWQAYIRG